MSSVSSTRRTQNPLHGTYVRQGPPADQRPEVAQAESTLGPDGQASPREAPLQVDSDVPARDAPTAAVPTTETAQPATAGTAPEGAPNSAARSERGTDEPAPIPADDSTPALSDEGDIGVMKHHVLERDGQADLSFTGTLLAFAPSAATKDGSALEYRIYETSAGKHVFSKISRSGSKTAEPTHEAAVFDPAAAEMPERLLESVRDRARSGPLTWREAAVEFFGYDSLAKSLYRRLGSEFEEHLD